MQKQAAVLYNNDPSFLQMTGHLNLVLQVTKRWYKVYVQGLTWNTSDFECSGGFMTFCEEKD